MPTNTIHPTLPSRIPRSARLAAADRFRKPMYDCQEQDGALHLTVFIPGVEAAGVNIEARGADLWVTARKTHFVRVNWQALHLEGAQLDYRLNLRLGRGYAYEAMEAEMHAGVLTIVLPKRSAAAPPAEMRRVA